MSHSRWIPLAVCLAACVHASFHVRVMDARSAPRAAPCADPPVETDHGPDRPRLALAVVTAECGASKEAECRQQLAIGTCQVDADAVVDVTRQRTAEGHLRMVGTAVEYLPARR